MDALTITKEQLADALTKKRDAAQIGIIEPLRTPQDEAWWLWEQLGTIVKDAALTREAIEKGDIERVKR